ncbi:PBP1A family penicillin-binding protein [Paenibacillus sp. HN-1]|uniref:transglycosylase domain-containing protein n=1 Tax=Paenibacillus TaxID=44249 RepID=UPI001CAA0785|nr:MULTISPECIES: PBP1A family penicillin-binding protein [Paenibacillus]MBY9082026.1 PBP1A family penicillin-binding protein [Paenibacillus sp. CGMCC 1.18879]MBY9085816.1 PBP1A family penicillin-binding protein [Paenibacillus sinensis]
MSNDEILRSNRHRKSGGGGEPPKPKKKRKLSRKKVLWTLFFTAALAIFCALGGYLFVTINGEKLLTENEGKLTVNPTTKIYDRNANQIAELALEKSDPVESDKIPQIIKDAFVATEDRRFYEHQGVDLWSIGRAAVKDVVARSMVEGGSTITQQLAKNIFLTRDKTFFRKATEMSIAMALERHKTKDEIITLYLNRINFGGTIYGIKAASVHYFGVSDLNQLKLWQIATLAAMPKGPSRYNPLRNPELSKERRGVVLQLMNEQGYITQEEMNQAKVINYNYKPPATKQKYQAFIDYVIDEAENKYGLTEDDLNIGGYKIYTTMDKDAQTTVENAFADADNFEKSVDDEPVQGSMVIINQETGGIVALMGGRNYEKKGFSRVNDSRRSPGSSIKPIVSYAPAIESGKFSMDSQISNAKQCFGDYCPTNLHGYSNTISMSEALTKSENIPAVWLLSQIGVGTGYDFAKKLGIGVGDNDRNLSLALGGMEKGTNTLEMAQAYTAFATGGEERQAYAIKSIADSTGETAYKANTTAERVMKESTAYQMTEMMQQVVQSGTGKKAKIDRPVAGKTGTTQSGYSGVSSNRDVWFVGYTPELTAAVWMGYDNPDRKHLLKNSSPLAAAFWGKVMGEVVKNYPEKSFPKPDNLNIPKPSEQAPEQVLAVTGLTGAYDASTGTVNLSWNPVTGDGKEYRVYRKETSEADFTQLVSTLSPNAADIGAMAGLTYEYYVTVYDPDTGTESDPSNTVSVLIEGTEPSVEPSPSPSPSEEPTPSPDQGTGGGPEQSAPGSDNGSGSNNGNGNGGGNVEGNGNGNANGNGSSNGNGNGNGNSNNGNSNGSQGGEQLPVTTTPSPSPAANPADGAPAGGVTAPETDTQNVTGAADGAPVAQ